MADISKIQVGSTTYDIKDATARSNIESIIQESAFEVAVEGSEYALYWYGAAGGCPYSVSLEGSEYILYFDVA